MSLWGLCFQRWPKGYSNITWDLPKITENYLNYFNVFLYICSWGWLCFVHCTSIAVLLWANIDYNVNNALLLEINCLTPLCNWILLSILLGCFCVYGSLTSLDFVRDCLDEMTTRSKYDSIDDSNPMQLPPPTFLILARNPNNDDIIHQLRKEGQELASRYMCTAFVNMSTDVVLQIVCRFISF